MTLDKSRPSDRKRRLTKYLSANMTEREIAKVEGKGKSTIHYAIQRDFTPQEIQIFKNQEADAIRALRLDILSNIDRDDIKKMISSRGMTDYGILYDKEMLERGHSPQSKPILVIVKGANAQVQINAGLLPTSDNPEGITDV